MVIDGVAELQAIRLEGITSTSRCKWDIVRCMALYHIYIYFALCSAWRWFL